MAKEALGAGRVVGWAGREAAASLASVVEALEEDMMHV